MKNQLIGLAAGILICTATVMADTFPNTLWVGNDGTAAAPILNTTTTGVVLRQIDNTAAVGLAIDSNKLYVNSTTSGGNIYNLDTLTTGPGDMFSLPNPSFDLTFSGGFLWAASFSTNTIDKVDPVMNSASSAVRKATPRAISTARPRRPTGMRATIFSSTSVGTARTMSVST